MTVESQQSSGKPATIVVQARRKWKVKDLKLEVSGGARQHDLLPPVLFWGTMFDVQQLSRLVWYSKQGSALYCSANWLVSI